MPSCAVAICTNHCRNQASRGFKFYGFPKNPEVAAKWIAACNRKDPVNWKTGMPYAFIKGNILSPFCENGFEKDLNVNPLK